MVTCAHHKLPRGAEVTVHVADGRTVPGKVWFNHPRPDCDLSLVKILDGGPWPTVELGKAVDVRRDELCICLGHPGNFNEGLMGDARPFVRVGRVADTSAAPLNLLTTCRTEEGDSGGPLLDLDARLIGIHSAILGFAPPTSSHVGIDMLRSRWDEMVAGKAVTAPVGLGDALAPMGALAARQQPAVAEILCDRRRAALGTVVGADGWVLTKAGELSGRITCRLPDGREVGAKLAATDPRHDLALLKVEAAGLTVAAWSPKREVSAGELVAGVAPRGGAASVGGVCYPAREIKPDGGGVNVAVKEADKGVEVEKVGEELPPIPLRVGDVVTHVDGVPTPDVKTWVDVFFKKKAVGGRPLVGGDRLTLTVRREGQVVEVRVTQSQRPNLWLEIPMSDRRSGFPSVFSADLGLPPNLCGGPVVDTAGEVVGVSIAAANYFETRVIPAPVAREVAEALKSAARQPAKP